MGAPFFLAKQNSLRARQLWPEENSAHHPCMYTAVRTFTPLASVDNNESASAA